MAKARNILSAAASLAASAMLIKTISSDLVPAEIQDYFHSSLSLATRYFSSQITIIVEEFQGHAINEVFDAANVYLGTRTTTSAQRFRVYKSEKEKNLGVTLDANEETIDVFEDATLRWTLVSTTVQPTQDRNSYVQDLNASLRSEVRHFELSFHRKHKDMVLSSYLPYVLERAKVIKEENSVVKLHTVVYSRWDTDDILLEHPMTFKTLALDSQVKKVIMDDLDNFLNGKAYYRSIGRAWKRGYLLYGPPGTGKSSLIAAMANYLKFDIYDLDLTDIESNSDLRFLLLSMPSRSMLVIEDIDCSIKLQNRESEEETKKEENNKVTLSGLLNFIDGLWSCCGEGRILVFSTNHKDKLDPALLRPGRMDMHIHMSYCNADVFKQLALNYLGICHHHLFEQILGLITEVNVTPAEVAGELMKSRDAEVSLQGLVSFLLRAKSTER